MNKVLTIPYAIDLGNGFTKRTNGERVIVEPSKLQARPDYFSSSDTKSSFRFQESGSYLVGNDTDPTKAISALGDDDLERYESQEFKQLLYAFIAKDFKESVTIPHLVTGLPVNHFKAKSETLKNIIKGKKVISIDDQEIIIDIKNVHVLPQPIGTYMYLVNLNKVDPETDTTLIVDGGHGSLDVTEMRGYTITARAGAEIGAKKAHIQIYNYLVDQFGDMRSITLSNIPNLLDKGLIYDGKTLDIRNIKEVKDILKNHFDEMFRFIRENKFSLKDYNQVIFTGGLAIMHKDLILEKNRNNFVVIDEAQEANVLGYFEYGKAVQENEKNSVVR